MACGCSKNNTTTQNQTTVFALKTNTAIVQTECNYTIDTVNAWMAMLECVNGKNALSDFNIQRALYNSFIGVLISIQRSPNYICNFAKELGIMQTYINKIVDSGIC